MKASWGRRASDFRRGIRRAFLDQPQRTARRASGDERQPAPR